ncbi:MAG: malonyl-ACP O-methyltransferase BioC [Gammaproteobacteria bacterium]|nr:malonyl-ACP O-methyltransferase BioC [Gammaproteobacteria bacterium]MDH5691625.1 malonyl-ACP O-methyltransferase BioC [Gammaproteobacteria bacterium]
MNQFDAEQLAYQVEKKRVKENFHSSSNRYDEVAVLQREVANRLLENLDYITLEPSTILDVGCGTGYCTDLLRKRFPKAKVIALDLALGMAQYAKNKTGWMERIKGKKHFVCGDAEFLPIKERSIDLVVSSLAIQWCNSLDQAFKEFHRIIRPGGLALFSTFGPDTLRELRSAWSKVDNHVHVNAFLDMHDIGDALMRTGLVDPVMETEHFTLTYPTVKSLMGELKTLGSRNSSRGRTKTLTGKAQFNKMIQAYEQFRQDNVLPASYEVVYGHAWPTSKPNVDSESTIRIDQIGGRREG